MQLLRVMKPNYFVSLTVKDEGGTRYFRNLWNVIELFFDYETESS